MIFAIIYDTALGFPWRLPSHEIPRKVAPRAEPQDVKTDDIRKIRSTRVSSILHETSSNVALSLAHFTTLVVRSFFETYTAQTRNSAQIDVYFHSRRVFDYSSFIPSIRYEYHDFPVRAYASPQRKFSQYPSHGGLEKCKSKRRFTARGAERRKKNELNGIEQSCRESLPFSRGLGTFSLPCTVLDIGKQSNDRATAIQSVLSCQKNANIKHFIRVLFLWDPFASFLKQKWVPF